MSEINNAQYKLSTEHRMTKVESELKGLRISHEGLKKDFYEFRDNHFEHFKTWTYRLLISNLLVLIGILITALIKL